MLLYIIFFVSVAGMMLQYTGMALIPIFIVKALLKYRNGSGFIEVSNKLRRCPLPTLYVVIFIKNTYYCSR